jgi:signal transduction histidine kinase
MTSAGGILLWIEANKWYLEQVVYHSLTNAIKYLPEDSFYR